MKSLLYVIMPAFLIVGCSGNHAQKFVEKFPEFAVPSNLVTSQVLGIFSAAGSSLTGGGSEFQFFSNMTYQFRLYGCLGYVTTNTGRWAIENPSIVLNPQKGKGRPRKPFQQKLEYLIYSNFVFWWIRKRNTVS
jgi:hypothetical protein